MKKFIISVLISLIIIAIFEVIFRFFGGTPNIIPGWTKIEFAEKIEKVKKSRTVYVIGDSRVGWGINSKSLQNRLIELGNEDIKCVNGGMPSASTGKIITNILDRKITKGVLVINYSIASFFHFTDGPGPIFNMKLQDVIDDRINIFLSQRVYTYGGRWKVISRFLYNKVFSKEDVKKFWKERIVYDGDYVNGVLALSNGEKPDVGKIQVDYYLTILEKIKKDGKN